MNPGTKRLLVQHCWLDYRGFDAPRIGLRRSQRGPPMRITQRLQIIRLFAVVALGICAALLVNAIQPIANFCAYVSDCQQVLTSSYSRVLGIPLPAFGVAAFGALIGLSLCTPVWARRLFRMLAAASGMTGLVLMVIQIAV